MESSPQESVEQGIYEDIHSFVKELFSSTSTSKEEKEDVLVQKGKSLSVILERLHGLVKASSAIKSKKTPDVYNLVSVLSHCIRGYLSLLPRNEISSLAERVLEETVGWLSHLFRYENSNGLFHEARLDGIFKVIKLALYMKYAKYASDGFTALYTRPPVIYVSAAAPESFGQAIKSHLGLPQSSVCTVPCNSMFGSPYTMDVAAFERLLTDDVSCGKTPLLLVGYAGTPLAGHTDNLGRLREVCTQTGVWFHVEGDTLTTLTLPQVPASISAATNADSLTLDIGKWFGMPSQPYCTLFRTSNLDVAQSVGLKITEPLDKLYCLPLWIMTQFMGTEDLQKIISHASEISQQLADRIDAIKGLKKIEQINTTSPVVLFKYLAAPELKSDSLSAQNDEDEGSPEAETLEVKLPLQMVDELNQLLLNEINDAHIFEAITVVREGLCMKFNPYPTCKENTLTKDDINQLTEKLGSLVIQLDMSLIARSSFADILKRAPNVMEVDTGMTLSIGAFQCIPKYWKTTNLSNLSDSKKREINSLNSDVFEKLSSSYPSLELLKNSTGQAYICIGLTVSSLDLAAFVDDLIECLDEVEDSSLFLESVSDAVQKSIHEAQERLRQETDEKLLEGGILRLVPVVGSLYNWWSPPPKDDLGVTGRSFQIAKGTLETTEKTYKLKMQVTEENENDRESQKSADSAGGFVELDQSVNNLDSTEDTAIISGNTSFMEDLNNAKTELKIAEDLNGISSKKDEEKEEVEVPEETAREAAEEPGKETDEATAEGTAEITAEETAGVTAEETAEVAVEETAEGTGEVVAEGTSELKAEGAVEGTAEGTAEGTSELKAEGAVEGTAEGTAEGAAEVIAEGTAEVIAEGTAEVAKEEVEDTSSSLDAKKCIKDTDSTAEDCADELQGETVQESNV